MHLYVNTCAPVLVIHSVIQQIFIEQLRCPRHWARVRCHRDEQDRPRQVALASKEFRTQQGRELSNRYSHRTVEDIKIVVSAMLEKIPLDSERRVGGPPTAPT